jgi:hypothetical protein
MIPEFLWHGAEAYGFRGRVWTCARVAKVIEQEFGITYIERGKSHLPGNPAICCTSQRADNARRRPTKL